MKLTRTTQKILKTLLESPLYEFKEIELINKSGVGKGSASQAINDLTKNKVLEEARVGKAKIISLNLQSPFFFLLKSLFDQEKLLQADKNKLSSVLFFKALLKRDIQLLVIFGSTIAGTSTEESDIDVLIITNNQEKVNKERKMAEEIFGQKFNLHVYAEKEIRNKMKEDAFIKNALLKGVTIYGYDTSKELLSRLNKGDINFQRLFFLSERINSAKKNYFNKDNNAAKEVIEKTLEQTIFYLLSEKGIGYASKVDAKNLINKLPEGRVITKINKSSLKEKIILSKEFIIKILRDKISEKEGL